MFVMYCALEEYNPVELNKGILYPYFFYIKYRNFKLWIFLFFSLFFIVDLDKNYTNVPGYPTKTAITRFHYLVPIARKRLDKILNEDFC